MKSNQQPTTKKPAGLSTKTRAILKQLEVRAIQWMLLVAGFWYAVAGGPQELTGLFTIAVVFLGWLLTMSTDEWEKKLVAGVMLVFIGITAMSILSPRPGYKPDDVTAQAGYWMVYKFLFVVALAYFAALVLEPMKKGKMQICWLVFGVLLQLVPFINVMHEHEHKAQLQHAAAETKNCSSVEDATDPWYTPEMVVEDLALGLMAAIIIAAMKASDKTSEETSSDSSKRQSPAKNRK